MSILRIALFVMHACRHCSDFKSFRNVTFESWHLFPALLQSKLRCGGTSPGKFTIVLHHSSKSHLQGNKTSLDNLLVAKLRLHEQRGFFFSRHRPGLEFKFLGSRQKLRPCAEQFIHCLLIKRALTHISQLTNIQDHKCFGANDGLVPV